MNRKSTKWNVITGPPGSGKTSTLQYLALAGFPVYPEVSRVLMNLNKSKGKAISELISNENEFELSILKYKSHLESNLKPAATIYLDRGVIDSEAFINYHSLKVSIQPYLKYRYNKIFYLEPLNLYKKEEFRLQDAVEAAQVGEHIKYYYNMYNYSLIFVKPDSIQNRVNFILNSSL